METRKLTTRNLTGNRYNLLTAIEKVGRSPTGSAVWRCMCDCGNTVDRPAPYLKNSPIASCGCTKRTTKKWQDIRGQRYGRLTVLELSHRNSRNEAVWKCKCDCGTIKNYLGTSFKYGKTRSCGCLHKEIVSGESNYQVKRVREENNGIHFSSTNHWYIKAEGIIKRCRQENIPYGFGKKIQLATHLQELAPKFCPVFGWELKEGRGQRDNQSYSVDKIIPEKGYVPGNIQIVSWLANAMKRDATPELLVKFALWVIRTFWKENMVGQSRNMNDVNLSLYALRMGHDLTPEECEEIRKTSRKGYTVARAVTEYIEKKESKE